MLYRGLLLALCATVHAWNECAFPDIGYFTVDEGLGLSFAYGAAPMNGKLYTGGYYQGHLALVGVTDSGEVTPEPSAALWGDVTSDVQNLYVAETNADGKMTKSWSLTGTGIQSGSPGHGPIANRLQVDGLTAMLDRSHLAVKGDFSAQVTLPDGTLWSQGKHSDGSVRLNTFNVLFVMKLDVSSTNGVGTGTTGWARMLDEDHLGVTIHPGGVDLGATDVHGDANGDMILTYTGYTGFDPTHDNGMYRGAPRAPGKGTGGVHYLTKLSAADGSEVWKKVVPKKLSDCTPTTDGIFCAYTVSSSDGAVEFGDGSNPATLMPAVTTTKTGIVKFSSTGVAHWAKATHDASYKHMNVKEDGTVLVIAGQHLEYSRYAPRNGKNDLLSRIDTSAGNEGNILWTDTGSGGGTHGFRGVQVSNDGTQVTTYGQINEGDPLTLTDSSGSATTVTSRGSYTVWVATYDATTGTGKWAMEGGSDGLDYFFAFGMDRDNNDMFVGGAVYDTPKEFQWGDVKRKNAMYQYKPSSDISGYIGTTKGFTVQIKSTTSPPSCLTNTCSGAAGPQASDVKPGMCYIDRHCYNAGDFAPYPGQHCMKCDPTTGVGRTAWTAPIAADLTTMCHINGKCVDNGAHPSSRSGVDPSMKCDVASSTIAYTPVKGYLLDMATFNGGSFYANGSAMASMTTASETTDMITSLRTESAKKDDTIVTHAKTIKDLETSNIELAADLKTAEADNDGEKMPTWAIAIIVIIGAMFLLVVVILGVVVSREQQGKPVFVPSAMKK
jgi:hypothetical protein